ncbi:PACE efflux transporter [Pseudooceanicola sp. CBS1P-1]|uniref:PACE efflux transporter n=1 Tax=Pseudooceanicola albus TaxID=2692189 RepID=A0A6L7G1L0_9RHOB|nr:MULTISPECIES: PACE efflux transporter [Pseudooceanicola]MBT9383542.1 PACE efflux transporter [Pseudooceanicola endophyticus]MXN17398.1 PACE efflux transporter [Pseudooceanicola albus]
MRSPLDRLRHTLCFEVLALLIMIPLGAALFGQPLGDIGVVGAVSATVAAIWNYVYNLMFDHAMLRLSGGTRKGPVVRVGHAVGLEITLLLMLLPFMSWYLGVPLWQALIMDLSFAAFYTVYALGFNWGYDRLFPLPEWRDPPAAGPEGDRA